MDKIPCIPKPLNEPIKLSKWEGGEIALFISVMMIFWMLGSLIIGVVIAFLSYITYKFLRKNPSGDLTKRIHYWFFETTKKKYKVFPPSYIREWLG